MSMKLYLQTFDLEMIEVPLDGALSIIIDVDGQQFRFKDILGCLDVNSEAHSLKVMPRASNVVWLTTRGISNDV